MPISSDDEVPLKSFINENSNVPLFKDKGARASRNEPGLTSSSNLLNSNLFKTAQSLHFQQLDGTQSSEIPLDSAKGKRAKIDISDMIKTIDNSVTPIKNKKAV